MLNGSSAGPKGDDVGSFPQNSEDSLTDQVRDFKPDWRMAQSML
jgi:hypothetical protein